jgi:hypothetical protein
VGEMLKSLETVYNFISTSKSSTTAYKFITYDISTHFVCKSYFIKYKLIKLTRKLLQILNRYINFKYILSGTVIDKMK